MVEVEKKTGTGNYISKLIFNNGQEVCINQNDIVLFVGPNNAGKSQSLKDIYELCSNKKPTIVVNDIKIVKEMDHLEEMLEAISVIDDHGGYKQYSGLGFKIASHSLSAYKSSQYYGEARPLFVTYLNTLKRLTTSNPAQAITRKATKTNPIHYVAFDGKYREWLADNFKKAFGKELIPHLQNGASIPLCIGDPVKFAKEFKDEQSRQEAYADILDTYEQVQNQGDGIKSFTGILLYLMLDYYKIFLIDEPESFLHPPQANIMGRIIGETLMSDQQAFISTHSEEIIKGLLDVCPDRVKIIRITRESDTNSFAILENKKFNDVWNDPLLKYSNIMSSLFHKNVILCESDSDCRIYSIIESHLREQLGIHSETLFIHCGGKHRMAKIAGALKALNISVKLIPDMDVMNNEAVFRGIAETFEIDWDSIHRDYKTIVSNLHSQKETISRVDFKNSVMQILNDSSNAVLSDKEIKTISAALRVESKWEPIKKSGIAALPSGDATIAYDKLDSRLRQAGIFMVPVGELECFVKQVGGHGPEWANKVLETYPDLDDSIYDEIKKFMKDVCELA